MADDRSGDRQPAGDPIARLRDLAASLSERAARSPARGEPSGASCDYAELHARVRAEVAARRAGYEESEPERRPMPRLDAQPVAMPRTSEGAQPIAFRDTYTLAELMAFDGEDFVSNAYRALLHREPEANGLTHHLELLFERGQSKVDMLELFANSEEGRRTGVRVRGLARAAMVRRWRRIPVLGSLIAVLQHVTSLPTVARNLERHEVLLYRRDHELRAVAEALDDLAARTATAIDAMGEALAGVDRDKAPRGAVQSLTGRVAELQHDLDRTQGGVEWRTTEELVARVAESASEAAARLSARLGELDERKAERADLRQVAARIDIRSPDPGFDEFYASYEDHFRGTRRDIKQRVAIYLPIVGRAQAGTPSAPVLDVGCGRGEWLELLRETGLAGRGVDSNPAMVSSDRQRGLDVVLGDGIAYLRGLDEGSLGAVTAMHLIEHLRFDDQVRLLDAALRALRPGGVAIFETPNPENLNVGAHTFWNDPTHVHPVPPEPLRVMAELRGFTRTEILRLHPYPTSAHLAGSAEPMRDHINHVLFGPQDYALVAFKS